MAAEGERKKKALQFYRPSYKWRKKLPPFSSRFAEFISPLFLCGKVRARDTRKKSQKPRRRKAPFSCIARRRHCLSLSSSFSLPPPCKASKHKRRGRDSESAFTAAVMWAFFIRTASTEKACKNKSRLKRPFYCCRPSLSRGSDKTSNNNRPDPTILSLSPLSPTLSKPHAVYFTC